MAAKVGLKHLDPASALKKAEQWSGVLIRALKHPGIEKNGCMRFENTLPRSLLRELGNNPVSKLARCRILLDKKVLDLAGVAGIAMGVQFLIRKGRRPLK